MLVNALQWIGTYMGHQWKHPFSPKRSLVRISGPKHHLIITGVGRSGTTFLIQLMTELGLDTGFHDTTTHVLQNCNAGMEWDLRAKDVPYVVKSPWLCDYLDGMIQAEQVVIDHMIIPMRDLYAAAESRRSVEKRGFEGQADNIPGGLWHTKNPDEQEQVLALQLYKLIYTSAKHGIPMTLLHFPQFITDPNYLYAKLAPVMATVRYNSFLKGFQAVSKPKLVHEFHDPQLCVQ